MVPGGFDMLEINTPAPDFTLDDQDGHPVSLKDFRGKKVILYFYPKDNTPGCTVQAKTYRDMMPAFEEKDAVVLGVSKDTSASHKKFQQKYDLPFILLADPDHTVNELYQVWKEKNMYGKKVFGTVRSTYLIDENGIIRAAKEKVKPEANPQDMLDALNALQDA
jgi:peroxiredoxin Q/BCP